MNNLVLQIQSKFHHIAVQTEAQFDVLFNKGSNLETEWFLDTNDTCLLKHDGRPRHLRLNFTLTIPGTHNVTVVAANTVTRTFDCTLVHVIKTLDSFSLEMDAREGSGEVSFYLINSDIHRHDFGNVRLNMTYGDHALVESYTLCYDDQPCRPCFEITHVYIYSGVYNVMAELSNEVDRKVIYMSVTVRSFNNTTKGTSTVKPMFKGH